MPLRRMVIVCDCRSIQRSIGTLIDLHVLSASSQALPLTGALVLTPTHAAAIIEGGPPSIEAVWSLIERDCPTCVQVRVTRTNRRRFNDWSRPPVGDAPYVQRAIDALVQEPDDAAVPQFERLVIEIVRVGGLRPDKK